MTTSLAQQLRTLSLPQVTSQFNSDRRRVSILFDEKEAANLDKATLHDIGVTGLTALTGVDPGFEKFHALLFSDATVDFDRLEMTIVMVARKSSNIILALICISQFVNQR